MAEIRRLESHHCDEDIFAPTTPSWQLLYEEQGAIADSVKTETAKMELLATKIEFALERRHEHLATQISAAIKPEGTEAPAGTNPGADPGIPSGDNTRFLTCPLIVFIHSVAIGDDRRCPLSR